MGSKVFGGIGLFPYVHEKDKARRNSSGSFPSVESFIQAGVVVVFGGSAG